MERQDDDSKLDLLQGAELVGVSCHTLRSWTRQRKIPFYRCGRRIVFSRQDLMNFLARCRVTSSMEEPK